MEFKEVVLHKLFLSGVICGLFIAGCSIAGFKYGQSYGVESFEQKNLNQVNSKTVINLKQQLNDKNIELSRHKENILTNKNDSEFIEPANNAIKTNNFNQNERKVTPRDKGFIPIGNQKVDIEWAPEFTNNLTDTFQLSDELYSLGLIKAIECKTTLCEIQFDLNPPEDFDVVFKIRDAFEQTELKKHGLVFDYKEKENMVKILVGRYNDSFSGLYQ